MSTRGRILNRLWRSLRTRGVFGTTEIARHRFHERFCDWRLGIDTGESVDVDQELGRFCHDYEATDYRLLDQALRLLPGSDESEENIVFLDYGCGKGRAVILAAMRPFKRVIGVDLHDGLLTIARENVAHVTKRLRCKDVSLLNVDATQFEVPDNVNAVFMFNPFRGDILQAVIAQINASLHRSPRTITLFYLYPPDVVSDPFAQLDGWNLVTEIPVGRHRPLRFPIYQTCLGDVDAL